MPRLVLSALQILQGKQGAPRACRRWSGRQVPPGRGISVTLHIDVDDVRVLATANSVVFP
ncbi:MAG: hypothetical protein CVT77_05015 [Alphaproteobacteria bacterium HGW-Alphaproteobacteria-16]|nr:MAG: hypothetical protein CVT77_05015 [Alphaproteobacteria bacterium HGW-Alphaproteobacteria-16]